MYKKIFQILFFVCLGQVVVFDAMARKGDVVPTVVILGDELLMGKGLNPAEDGFVQLLEKYVKSSSKLVNLSREGEKAESLVGRVNEVLSYKPNIVVLSVGVNDALAQIEPDVVFGNLESVLNALYGARVNVLLLGIKAPPSLSDDYELRFNRIYSDLAMRYQTYFLPNLMDDIYDNQKLSQLGGVLPNADGVKLMYERFSPVYKMMLGDFIALTKYCRVNSTHAKCNTIDF